MFGVPRSDRAHEGGVEPRAEAREFCGKCHGAGVAAKDAPKEAPKIDLAAHGGRYLCWECHYPHLPEGRK